MDHSSVTNTPTVLVVFGATGDLMAKKIIPSLYHLWNKQKLPQQFSLVGISRQELSNEAFRARVKNVLEKHADIDADPERQTAFAKQCSYSPGLFDQPESYTRLAGNLTAIDKAWNTCSNKLFYLAVPPSLFEQIMRNLAASGLTVPCGGDKGWSRVLIEKPFGKNEDTARKLDELMGSLFKEQQIYRIDHYLAKEMLQNILAFRFSNNLFEESWDRDRVESIELRLFESIGAEDRGAFYDGVGAFRDVGQNHLLQMLALVTMDVPGAFTAEAIRAARAALLRTLTVPTREEAEQFSFRAQHEGYRSIKGVDPQSTTETYFKVRGFLDHPQWRGVPFILESGKRMGAARKEVVLTFKHPSPCLCPPTEKEHFKNRVIFSLEPQEGITIQFWSKKPGLEMVMEERDFSFQFREGEKKTQYTEEYEKLLIDCIHGDQTLFVSTEEVRAMWGFSDPFVEAWAREKVPLRMYAPDTAEVSTRAWFVGGVEQPLHKTPAVIGFVGQGKMGKNMATRLAERGWHVLAYDSNPVARAENSSPHIASVHDLCELVAAVPSPRIIWLMVPAFAKASAGKPAVSPVDETLAALLPHLTTGDIVIDGGNSYYKDAVHRSALCAARGVEFLDVGTSGGPGGARNGACIMVGGNRATYQKLHTLWEDLAVPNGFGYMGSAGAGHFVKMVHNGIEYGMMQALAEGFAVMKQSNYKLNFGAIAELYNHGSVIESRLVGWLKTGFAAYGEELEAISGTVAHTGEGEWTVKTAQEFGIPVPIIEGAFRFRVESGDHPSYTGKILSALRNQFGGHSAGK